MPTHPAAAVDEVLRRIASAANTAGRPAPRILAASKAQTATAIAELATRLRTSQPAGAAPAFGENYVQEALDKQRLLDDANLEWHLIGHLQSNKAREAAAAFDWVQTVDRDKLVSALAQYRPASMPPLNVLIQVNIDDETSKHGCRPEAVVTLAEHIQQQPRLKLRGLMAIPAPHPDPVRRREAFARMRVLFEHLRAQYADIDTLSIGMSDDYPLAIAEGATMVRIGTALFGPRPTKHSA